MFCGLFPFQVLHENEKMGKTIKVVVCGMKGVGKTAILEQVVYGNMTERTVSVN